VDFARVPAYFTSMGPTADARMKPELCAMGVKVFAASAAAKHEYKRVSGTSFSAPLVASAISLIFQLRRDLTPGTMREALLHTCEDVGSLTLCGRGVMNSASALNYSIGEDCSSYCKHGACLNGVCNCEPGYFERDCSISFVPCNSYCGAQGTCDAADRFCSCEDGWYGVDCSLRSRTTTSNPPIVGRSSGVSASTIWIIVSCVVACIVLAAVSVGCIASRHIKRPRQAVELSDMPQRVPGVLETSSLLAADPGVLDTSSLLSSEAEEEAFSLPQSTAQTLDELLPALRLVSKQKVEGGPLVL